MYDQVKSQNAIAAIRVSSLKQGTDGDSPDAQKEQIDRYVENRGIKIKKYFVFLESASREQQPMQEAIDYCKDPKHHVQLFIVKSIDRFTRGGSHSYNSLKMQLENCGVQLTDIYGVIGTHKVNTLEHLGVSYYWSVYDPTKNSEILEAERASDEKRDIMSRMIGSQIRYARIGYWMRRPPMGLKSQQSETYNGKRCILIPHPIESRWIIKIFELRARGTLNDEQIVEEVNGLGFKTRMNVVRSKTNKRQIIARKGCNELSIKGMRRYIQNPVYAGVICEKWTFYKPVRGKFDNLVSIELFNRANRGLISIHKTDEGIEIQRRKDQLPTKMIVANCDYPYKRCITCSDCDKYLCGSAARGKSGKHYPAYHCNRRRGHYFRVPKAAFEETISWFVSNVRVAPRFAERISQAVVIEWNRRQQELKRDNVTQEMHLSGLELEARQITGSLRFLTQELSIRRMEEELAEVERQISVMKAKKPELDKKDNPEAVAKYAKKTLNKLENWLLVDCDPITKGIRFGVLFDKAPRYSELLAAQVEGASVARLSEVFIQSSQ